MFYDALTIAAVRDELRQKILGGWVQRVQRLSEHSIGFEIYAHHERHWLLMSAHPQNARVLLSSERLTRGSEDVSPLLLLLRKHVRDGRLVAIEQPPLERVLILTMSKRADDPADGIQQCKLIIEIMGRYSNIVLVDESDVVLDSARRVPAQLSRYRVVLPRHPYVPPPPQRKVPPEALTAELLGQATIALAPDAPLWQALVAAVAGMSPLLARETAFRATGDASATAKALASPGAAERLCDVTRAMYAGLLDHVWSPSVAREVGAVVAFAPYLLTHVGDAEPYESISAAADAYYSEVEQFTAGEQRKVQVRAKLDEARQRHLRRKEALERSLAQGREAERLRRSGELILSAVASIAAGQERLEGDGFLVTLDPRLSPVENAQAYFREYRKAKGALQQVPEMLAGEEAALAYLDEVAAQLDLADTVDAVRRVAADLDDLEPKRPEQKPARPPKGKGKQRPAKAGGTPRVGPPPYRVLPGGFEVYVGRSARQNEELTFHTAGPEDLWLHARGVPGAHVVIKARGRDVPEDAVEAAARLAATFSQARGSSRVAVDCTRRKHVRRVREGLPGLVTYADERTLHVTPEAPED